MLNCKSSKNKRAQIGETLTWILATLVIVFILIVFVFISSAMGESKKVDPKKLKIKIDDESKEITWIEVKTLFAKNINGHNLTKIDGWISQEEIDG